VFAVKTTIAAILLTLVPIVGEVDKAAPPRVVTLSLQRLATESTEGRAANQRLQSLAQKMAGDLAAKQKELQQQTTGTVAERQAELQRIGQQSQADFANTQRQLQTELRAKLNPLVAEIAGQHGVELVLNSDTAVVWSAPSLDITAEVLSRMNGTPSPSPAPAAK
jgi:Skp family chaperone for outer membrane proteins